MLLIWPSYPICEKTQTSNECLLLYTSLNPCSCVKLLICVARFLLCCLNVQFLSPERSWLVVNPNCRLQNVQKPTHDVTDGISMLFYSVWSWCAGVDGANSGWEKARDGVRDRSWKNEILDEKKERKHKLQTSLVKWRRKKMLWEIM